MADFKSEYIAGEVLAMSGASGRHETIVVNLTRDLSNALRRKPCKPKGGNLRVRVRSANFLYPDLTVVCGEPNYADGEYLDTLLNPSVIFEILSGSTESKDRGPKWRLYQQIESLEHYVIINQDMARVEIYTRHNDVDWLVHTEEGLSGAFSLSAIDVTLSLAELYEDVALAPDILND
ncbi:hypothetical protein CCAX7_005530 [Capsulimonas corticalis]|uniref:Uncharacterized protein n=2 Tax=Capsulimonas corticalis TaxID=2219043 RepID=A0A402D3A7_9BACT|nr:hypothetical protein CCAX7_005530 [Capsulimonas corticalis]